MMIRLTLIILAFAPPLVAEEVVFEDPFTSSLGDGWHWVRENKDAWRIDESGLHLRSMGGALWRTDNSGPNVLLRRLPDWKNAALIVEVTLRSQPVGDFEHAGLVLYYDDDHYINIVREHYTKDQPFNNQQVVGMGVERNARTQVANSIACRAEDVQLRLFIASDVVRADFRTSTKTRWRLLGAVGHGHPPKGRMPQIGLYAGFGPTDAERWVHFSGFRITKTAIEKIDE